MKKRAVAILLSMVLVLSCPLTVFAASLRMPDFGEVVAAVQADLNDRTGSISKLAKLNVSLLRSLTERLKNTEITVDDVKAAADEASALLAKVYEKMGSYAADMLEKAKTKLEDAVKPREPSPAPDDGNNGGNGNTGNTGNNGSGNSGNSGNNGGTKPTEPATPAEPAETVTFADMSDVLKKYLFIKVDDPDDVAALIAESCEFTYTTVQSGDGTVYIRVNIEENPQIFNYGVFRRLVEDLYARQGEEMLKNGDGSVDYVMSYEHIAGELALHALLYAASNELLRLTGIQSSRILNLYKAAAQADLNVDEARLPTEIFSILGTVLMNFLSFHLLAAFGLI